MTKKKVTYIFKRLDKSTSTTLPKMTMYIDFEINNVIKRRIKIDELEMTPDKKKDRYQIKGTAFFELFETEVKTKEA